MFPKDQPLNDFNGVVNILDLILIHANYQNARSDGQERLNHYDRGKSHGECSINFFSFPCNI